MAPMPILLLTRPEAASRRFLQALESEELPRFTPLISPLIGIEPRGPLPGMDRVRGVIFTSANAVRAFTALGGTPRGACYVVGEATAAAAREAGFEPQSAGGDVEALLAMILAQRPEGPLLHLRGTHAHGALAERLSAAGIAATGAVIYDQPALELSAEALEALQGDRPVVLPLFSPRSARQFAKTPAGAAPLIVAAMSEKVAAEVDGLYLTRLEIPGKPDPQAMRRLVATQLRTAATLVEDDGSVES